MKKGKIKNYIILVLIILLAWNWFGPGLDLSDFSLSTITGALVSGSNEGGVEDDAYYLGDKDAPVTMIEFSDFQCPYCQRAYETLKQIEKKYVEKGKVKIVFRHLPLSFHQQAEPAALAALCAGEQEKFWEYHDLLFENQNRIGSSLFFALARDLKLDEAEFKECFDSQEYKRWIIADQRMANQNRITGTPGFLINGELVKGAQPLRVFEETIERKLAE